MKAPNLPSIKYFLTSVAAISLLGHALFVQAGVAGPKEDSAELQALGVTPNYGKWTGGIVPWVYNPTGAPPGFTDNVATRDLIEAALAEWEGVCNVKFVRSDTDGVIDGIDATINIDEDPRDFIAVFQFANIGGAGLAGPFSTSATDFALGRWNYDDGTLRLSDTVFNQNGMTASAIQRNLLAFNQTVIHEAGHLIGLGHSDQPVSIMYSNPYNSLNHIRTDDIENCRNIYGYSPVYTAPELYVPGAAGVDNFDSFSFVLASDIVPPYTPVTSIEDDTDDSLGVRWQITTSPGYVDTLTQVVVDPQGYLSTIGTTQAQNGFFGQFSIASFDLLRELPGTWTVYIYDSTGLLETMTFDVNTSLPAIFNERPIASISYTETPDTRNVEVTATVTGDPEGQDVTIIWHIPTVGGAFSTALGGSSGSDTQNVNLNNLLNNEVFVEVNDNGGRYNNMLPGFGPAGVGFQNLFRYNSSNRKIGPDVDGDNYSDILWRNTSTGKNWLYEMGGNKPKTSAGINTVGTDWDIAGNGDYNGDGKTDILWRNNGTGKNWMYLMDGSTVLSSVGINTVSDPLWEVVGNGDYNGDGKSDILWRHATTGKNWMYLMNSAMVMSSVGVNTVDTAWKVVGSGDYNGDGNSDILWRNSSTGKNWMYLMNGATVQTSAGINTVADQNWQIVGSGDYNGDGNSDILWRNQGVGGTGSNFMYLMNGPTVVDGGGVRVLSDLAWTIVGSGDYDGDSDSDILWRNISTGKNWIYLMDGLTRTGSVGINTVSAVSPGWEVVNTN